MKNVTLKEYFEIKNYGKGKTINISKFASIVDVSISYISKLYNCQPISNGNSKTFEKISNYLAKDGYNLVLGNTIDFGYNNIIKHNDKLLKENNTLKLENKLLKEQLEQYQSLIKLCNLVVKNEKELKEINFSKRAKKYKKKGN